MDAKKTLTLVQKIGIILALVGIAASVIAWISEFEVPTLGIVALIGVIALLIVPLLPIPIVKNKKLPLLLIVFGILFIITIVVILVLELKEDEIPFFILAMGAPILAALGLNFSLSGVKAEKLVFLITMALSVIFTVIFLVEFEDLGKFVISGLVITISGFLIILVCALLKSRK